MIDKKTVKQEVHHTKHPEYVQVVHNGGSVYSSCLVISGICMILYNSHQA